MRHQLVVIAIIGIVLLSGCSMLGIGNNSDVDQPTAQPNTVTGDHEVTSTHDGTAGTQTVSATPTERIGNVVTQPPDSTGGDADAGTSTDTPIESQSDATPRPTDSPSDDSSIGGETETDDDQGVSEPDEPDQNETDTGDNSSDENTSENESTSLPESGTVLRVHDANILDIETDDGDEVTVRLIGIDVPQPLKRNTNPEAWGLNDTNDTRTWVAQHGRDARKFTADSALGEKVRLESVRRDDGVVVAQVYVGDMHINHALLGQGYARYNSDDTPFIGNGEYGEAEYWAKDDDRGIWGYDQ